MGTKYSYVNTKLIPTYAMILKSKKKRGKKTWAILKGG